jgi:hypothetical protein
MNKESILTEVILDQSGLVDQEATFRVFNEALTKLSAEIRLEQKIIATKINELFDLHPQTPLSRDYIVSNVCSKLHAIRENYSVLDRKIRAYLRHNSHLFITVMQSKHKGLLRKSDLK